MLRSESDLTNVFLEVAIELDISSAKVKEAVDEYYKGIVHIIESGTPHEIKLDYFGKIKAVKSFYEIEKKIRLKFGELKKRNYELISER